MNSRQTNLEGSHARSGEQTNSSSEVLLHRVLQRRHLVSAIRKATDDDLHDFFADFISHGAIRRRPFGRHTGSRMEIENPRPPHKGMTHELNDCKY